MTKKTLLLAFLAVTLWVTGPVMAATVAQWHFDEGSGTTAADSSSNGHDIANVGIGFGSGYSWATGKSGNCVIGAVGNDSYLYADIGTDTLSYEVTIDCWVKPTATDGINILMSLKDGFTVRFNPDGYGIGFIVATAVGWQEVNPWVTDTPWGYVDGNWHRLTMVYNGNAGHIRLFWDGELKAISDFDVSSGPLKIGGSNSTGPQFYIGASSWGPMDSTMRYDGSIDELTISDTDLYPIPDVKIIGEWHMDDGSGTVIVDSGAFENDMTITGSDWTWTTGKVNGGLLASDSSTTYASVLSKAPLPSRQVTAQAWIKTTQIDMVNGSFIVGQGWAYNLYFTDPGNNALAFALKGHNPNNDPNTDGNYQVWYGPANEKLLDGQWHHVAGVFDGIPNAQGKSRLSLYVDFVKVAEQLYDGPLTLGHTWQAPTSKIVVGAHWDDPSYSPYYGSIDELRIDAAALTKFGCGMNGYLPGDVNQDCIVDIKDFALMASNWLECNDPYDAACW